MVRRRVGGLRKGSENVGGIKRGCSRNRGSRFRGRVKGRVPVQVCIRVYYTSGKLY